MAKQTEFLAGKRTAFEQWVENEGLDLIGGYHVEDLRALPLKPWSRKGGLGAFIKLEGTGWETAAYVCEIPLQDSLKSQRHLYEENIYILQGEGVTKFRTTAGAEQTLKWKEGSLFSIPLNTWYQHMNTGKDKPVRYVAVTLAQSMINIFRNTDFIFNCPFDFTDRFNGEDNFFSRQQKAFDAKDGFTGAVVEINFIEDLPSYNLHDRKERGAGAKNTRFELAENVLSCHSAEFAVGTYKKTHRHGPAAHIIILRGKGYSLMWPEGSPVQRFDWQEGSLIVPPDQWWHQHFNTGDIPVRYLALHGMRSRKYRLGMEMYQVKNVKEGGNQMEYEDEAPEIREMFEAELAKSGVKCQMPKIKN